VIESSLAELLAEHELVLIEGAGSPAEINLYDIDLANMHVARLAGAAVVLVADIDRGGAFAHLYGTWAMLPAADRARIAGFLLNRFRGDPALLSPAPAQLQELTGVTTLGVLPWLEHALPDEDGAAAPAAGSAGRHTVAVAHFTSVVVGGAASVAPSTTHAHPNAVGPPAVHGHHGDQRPADEEQKDQGSDAHVCHLRRWTFS
jgi:adenosylcobyric acid synthase